MQEQFSASKFSIRSLWKKAAKSSVFREAFSREIYSFISLLSFPTSSTLCISLLFVLLLLYVHLCFFRLFVFISLWAKGLWHCPMHWIVHSQMVSENGRILLLGMNSLTNRRPTQISTSPRATKQHCVKCRSHVPLPVVPKQGVIPEEGGYKKKLDLPWANRKYRATLIWVCLSFFSATIFLSAFILSTHLKTAIVRIYRNVSQPGGSSWTLGIHEDPPGCSRNV